MATKASPKRKHGVVGPSISEPARVEASRLRNDPWPQDFAAGLSIGQCFDLYHQEHRHRRKEWTYVIQNTLNQFLLVNNMDEGWPVSTFNKQRCLVYKQALLNGTAQGPTKRKPTPQTIDQKLRAVRHFAKWCLNNDHLQVDPMAGVVLPPRLVSSSRVQKEGFTDEHLTQIFQALAPYKSDPDPMRREWFWVTVLLAFSGARAFEVIKLQKQDIIQKESVWCFNLVDRGGRERLKTRVSARVVPLHSEVLKAGFLEFVKGCDDVFLFPKLLPYGSQKTSGWTAELLKRLGIKRKELTQHSFRHTVTVKLERARVHYSIMRRILGHTIGKSVEDRVYLGSLTFSAKELQEGIEALIYPDAVQALTRKDLRESVA